MVYSSIATFVARPTLSRRALTAAKPSSSAFYRFYTDATSQVMKEDVSETRRYLERLKDAEIEFQSQGEHVSGDFWNSEPGNYRANNHVKTHENEE